MPNGACSTALKLPQKGFPETCTVTFQMTSKWKTWCLLFPKFDPVENCPFCVQHEPDVMVLIGPAFWLVRVILTSKQFPLHAHPCVMWKTFLHVGLMKTSGLSLEHSAASFQDKTVLFEKWITHSEMAQALVICCSLVQLHCFHEFELPCEKPNNSSQIVFLGCVMLTLVHRLSDAICSLGKGCSIWDIAPNC